MKWPMNIHIDGCGCVTVAFAFAIVSECVVMMIRAVYCR